MPNLCSHRDLLIGASRKKSLIPKFSEKWCAAPLETPYQWFLRQLLLAALGVAGALLLNQPAMTQLASETHTFSGEVASTCSINGLNSGYALSSSNFWLSTSYKAFEVNANSA